ncbi:pyridoxamine 5'-phosphate oxidase [Neisseria macacae ATCC 33926]|uniref:Pyridoxamine 5'-phosphate oxidase n=1 Tax=Neisseria macacae ATCC 33926 TaxID=997348 RepID=A0AA36ULS9_9NEIS|nr:pyridoxamine 5'-phosphate oxidase [Neisseria macacae ATCC 33926]
MKGRLKTYIRFSDDLFVSIVFVDRVHATVQVLPTDRVAWALPTSH